MTLMHRLFYSKTAIKLYTGIILIKLHKVIIQHESIHTVNKFST